MIEFLSQFRFFFQEPVVERDELTNNIILLNLIKDV